MSSLDQKQVQRRRQLFLDRLHRISIAAGHLLLKVQRQTDHFRIAVRRTHVGTKVATSAQGHSIVLTNQLSMVVRRPGPVDASSGLCRPLSRYEFTKSWLRGVRQMTKVQNKLIDKIQGLLVNKKGWSPTITRTAALDHVMLGKSHHQALIRFLLFRPHV